MQKNCIIFPFLVGWTNLTLSISSSHILNLVFWGQRVDTIGTSHQISLLLLDAKLDLFWPSVSPFIPLVWCLSYNSEDVAKVFVCMVGDLLIVEESYTLGSVSFKLTSSRVNGVCSTQYAKRACVVCKQWVYLSTVHSVIVLFQR